MSQAKAPAACAGVFIVGPLLFFGGGAFLNWLF